MDDFIPAALLCCTLTLGAFMGAALGRDAGEMYKAKDFFTNACALSCGDKVHSADRAMCVCTNGTVYKYDLKGLYK